MNSLIKPALLFFMMAPGMLSSFPASPKKSAQPLRTPVTPVTFIENKGQWEPGILYKATSTNVYVCFLKNGLSFTQFNDEREEEEENLNADSIVVWNMKFISPSSALEVSAGKGNESKYSYLSGNDPGKWVIHPKEFLQINYTNLYPNIDLQFYGMGNTIKNDYIVYAGGNIKSIKAYYEGIKHLSINGNGELEINTLWNKQLQKAPVAWQEINGEKITVKIIYEILNDSTFGFNAVNGYDSRYDLVIDPLFQMVWSSYTNITGANNNMNYCFGSAMDNAGNVYLTGMVDDTYPITPGAYSGPGNIVPEVFVAKFSGDGSTLLYWTYLPGSSTEHGSAIVVDDSGRAYVTGIVDLNFTGLTNFPSTANAYQPVHSTNGRDAFLTVLNSNGTGLVYSSFLGGTGGETGYGIALGPTGIAYVTGTTSSTDFPIVASAVSSSGSTCAFVSKFDITQTGTNSLIYSTKIGGGAFNNVDGRSIAVNSAGNAFITGKIYSSGSLTFPTTPGAYASVYNSGSDNAMSYVTKFSATTPVSLSYSTLLAPGIASAIAVDNATGDAFIVGETRTPSFPTTPGALQSTLAGASDLFATRLNATGTSLVYSTFIGGPPYEYGTGVAVNSAGEAYVVGIVQNSFPVSPGAYQATFGGAYDLCVVNINASGTGYGCGGSTYVGGDEDEYHGSFNEYASPHVSIRDHGGNNDTICVSATSHSQNFPTTPGVYGPVKVNGIADQPVFFKMTCLTAAVQPVANFSSNVTTTCDSISVNFTDSSLNNPDTWLWSFPGAIPNSSSSQNPQGIIFPASGLYIVSLRACNQAGCDSTSTTVMVNAPQPISINHGNDTLLCNGNTVTLAADPGFASYSWYHDGNQIGSNSDTVNVNQTGVYSVAATDLTGCTSSDTINVTIENPVAAFEYVISFDCNGALVRTENKSQNATGYLWNFGDGFASTDTNPTHYYSALQNPSIQLTATNGACADVFSVDSISFEALKISEIPNVFTPNGDGKNDCFEIAGVELFSGCFSIDIFNRWGNLVYTSDNSKNCWDGKNKNAQALPDGVYFYLITIKDEKLKGIVQLLR